MISVDGISKTYATSLLRDARYAFPSSSVTLLMGANGTGKTTLLKCILGLEDYRGTIEFDGQPLSAVRSQIIAVFDDTPFYTHLNGRRNLELLLERGVGMDEAAAAFGGPRSVPLLRQRVATYSSGQRKRLGLAYARLARPRYLLLDEVANGLDFESMLEVAEVIRELAADTTVLLTGHQFDFYARVIDRVVVLRHGKLEAVELDEFCSASLESVYGSLLAHSGSGA